LKGTIDYEPLVKSVVSNLPENNRVFVITGIY